MVQLPSVLHKHVTCSEVLQHAIQPLIQQHLPAHSTYFGTLLLGGNCCELLCSASAGSVSTKIKSNENTA